MIRLVATDLDGTLLGADGRIPDANVAAVHAAAAEGVRFVVATGRPLRWLDVLDALVDAHPLVIVSNGAALYDVAARRVVERRPLARPLVAALGDELRAAIPGSWAAIERGDLFGCEPGWTTDHDYLPGRLVAPWPELLDRVSPVLKLLLLHHGRSSDDLARLATPVVGDRATVTHSLLHDDFGLLEVSAAGVTKASALATLCERLGVAASEVLALGDMPNDADMLEWAGRAVVMSNGHYSLRERFEVVENDDSHGVARALASLVSGG